MSLTSTVVDLAISTTPRQPVDLVAQTEVSTGGLRSWISDNIVFTILILIACVVLAGSMRGNMSKVVTVGGLSLVGLAFLGLATNQSAATGIGNWILGLFGVNVS